MKPVTILEAPNNLNLPTELFPEAISYLLFKEHPIFIHDAQINNQLASASPDSPNEDNSAISPSTDDPKGTMLCQQMTAKGFFKSCNKLWAEEKDRKRQKW